ncbi:MAG: hypothetical protein Q4E35_08340 [Eubacteriales bacterium]|nr:hypothetical protein [Eubacteriales bacterium]
MNNRGAKYYLIAAIVWTVIALAVLYVLFFASTANFTAKLCGLFLIVMCVAGQWLRYRKMK